MITFSVRGRLHRAKGFIFDKDGTLLTFDHWAAVMRARAEALRRVFPLTDALVAELLRVMGMDPRTGGLHPNGAVHRPRRETEEAVTRCLSPHTPLPFPSLRERIRVIFAEVDRTFPWEEHLRPTPGAVGLLERLKGAGARVGVVTHDSTAPAQRHLEHAGFKGLVDAVVGLDGAPAPKPHPGGVLRCCELLGISPHEAVMVGDGPEDIGAGRAAGCALTVGVLTGKGRPQELGGADLVIETLEVITLSRGLSQDDG